MKRCSRTIFIRTDVFKTPCRLLAACDQGPAVELGVQQTRLFSCAGGASGLGQQVPALVRRGRGGTSLLNVF